jgi:hypothetical protein
MKLKSDFSGALSIRNKMGGYGNYLLGVGIQDLSKINEAQFGVEVNLNL